MRINKVNILGLMSGLVVQLNNPIFKNIMLVTGIGLFLKMLAFVKETFVASSFGISKDLDSFFIAALIPTFLQIVFIGGIKALFIPNYIKDLHDGNSAKSIQTAFLLSISLLSILLMTLIWFVFRFYIPEIFAGHETEFYQLIDQQLFLIIFCIPVWAISGFLSALLEMNNRFFISSISDGFTSIVTIFLVVYFSSQMGPKVLALGLLIGTLISLTVKLFITLKYRYVSVGKIEMNQNLRVMFSQYPSKIISAFLTGINPFVDQFFAAQLVVGSIAAINYGSKIPAFISAILLSSMGSVLLPYFSRSVTIDQEKAFKNLSKILSYIFVGTGILSVLLIFNSNLIVHFLFERGKFDEADTLVVGSIQKISLIYVPFYIGTLVIVKFLTAINKNGFMAMASTWNLIFNLTLNIILVKYFGLYGIVWSTTLVYIVNFFLYFKYVLHCRKTSMT